MCQGSFNGVSRVFQGSLKKVSRVFHKSFKGILRKIEGYFKGVFSVVEGYFKEIQQTREYLVNILIMHEQHFHFLSVVADRLQDHPTACLQLQNEMFQVLA